MAIYNMIYHPGGLPYGVDTRRSVWAITTKPEDSAQSDYHMIGSSDNPI